MVLPSSRPVTEGAYNIVDFKQGHLRNPDARVSDIAFDVRPTKRPVRAHLEDFRRVRWTMSPFPNFPHLAAVLHLTRETRRLFWAFFSWSGTFSLRQRYAFHILPNGPVYPANHAHRILDPSLLSRPCGHWLFTGVHHRCGHAIWSVLFSLATLFFWCGGRVHPKEDVGNVVWVPLEC